MKPDSKIEELLQKMKEEGLGELARANFKFQYEKLFSSENSFIPSSSIEPAENISSIDELDNGSDKNELKEYFKKTAIIKLNGGLGTSMGLNKAKSLIKVKNGLNFLEIISSQIVYLREKYSADIPFILMNSFRTEEDSLQVIKKSEELTSKQSLPFSFLQNKIPKISTKDFAAGSWRENPELEWCPPGHGDFYVALLESGLLDKLLKSGAEYLFVSNSDNLGATLDSEILTHFAKSKLPFLMEVTKRTSADKKGGHLAKMPSGQLILRELAQCPEADISDFQNIERHRFFNTNNIWINLVSLKEALEKHKGVLPLPLIRNKKHIEPNNKESLEVYQLETAIGSAISVFKGASAIEVNRDRFIPVKQTSDLLLLRSDIYEMEDSGFLKLNPKRKLPLPKISLNPEYYKTLKQFEERFGGGSISLIDCDSLSLIQDVGFKELGILVGDVEV